MRQRALAVLNLWLVVGSCLLCTLAVTLIDTLMPVWTGPQAEAEVLDVLPGSRYDPLSLEVQFRTAAGETVVSEAQGGPFRRYEVGQRVRVVYDPADLERVVLPEQAWFGAGLIGLAMLPLGVLPLLVGLRRGRARLATPGVAS